MSPPRFSQRLFLQRQLNNQFLLLALFLSLRNFWLASWPSVYTGPTLILLLLMLLIWGETSHLLATWFLLTICKAQGSQSKLWHHADENGEWWWDVCPTVMSQRMKPRISRLPQCSGCTPLVPQLPEDPCCGLGNAGWLRTVQLCHRLPSTVMPSPSLEVFQTQLVRALSNLFWPQSWPALSRRLGRVLLRSPAAWMVVLS